MMTTHNITVHDLTGRTYLDEADRIVARLEQSAREREQRREQQLLDDANGEWSFDVDVLEIRRRVALAARLAASTSL